MKKILIVFGTRPEAIKMIPLIFEFNKFSEFFQLKICNTGQHKEMLDQVLNLFSIKVDYNLDVMKKNQNLSELTSSVLSKMTNVCLNFKPDLVLVHGDTTTTLSASLSAFYNGIEIAHVEAGLRTNNIYSPWPEEMNRQLTDRISNILFAPTQTNKDNLIKENISEEKIIVTGNTVIDTLFFTINRIMSETQKEKEINFYLKKSGYEIPDLNKKIILVTGHRRENFGEGFINICKAINNIALENPHVDIVYPVHLNPNVQRPVSKFLSGLSNVYLLPPLDYEPFVYLMNRSYLILTDSGGIQEEAPSLGKPVVVMREDTERNEAVLAGTVKLVGTSAEKITSAVNELLSDYIKYEKMSKSHNPYGDGKASERIVEYLIKNYYGKS